MDLNRHKTRNALFLWEVHYSTLMFELIMNVIDCIIVSFKIKCFKYA